jgi:hypothetical protein
VNNKQKYFDQDKLPFSDKEVKKYHSICHPDSCPTCFGLDGIFIACPNKTWCTAKKKLGNKIGDITMYCDRRKHKTGKHCCGAKVW